LPRGARRVYVTGVLMLHGAVDELPAVAGWMKRIEVIGGETWLRAAGVSDLAWLAHGVIERGSLVVRAEYGVGGEASAVALPEEPGRVFTLRLPGLPSMGGLLAEVGDEIVAGLPMARYVDDAALERAEGEVERARRGLALAESGLAAAEELAEIERVGWAAESLAAEEEAQRVGMLVEAGARPRTEGVEAGRRVE